MPLIEIKTAKLRGGTSPEASPASLNRLVDIGTQRPWRIALVLKKLSLTLVLDLTDSILLGRLNQDGNSSSFVDLRAFGAEEAGVSRQHLLIRLDGNAVTICDLNSSNGTLLNGTRLEPSVHYPVRHKDEIALGLLEMHIELLTDPMN